MLQKFRSNGDVNTNGLGLGPDLDKLRKAPNQTSS